MTRAPPARTSVVENETVKEVEKVVLQDVMVPVEKLVLQEKAVEVQKVLCAAPAPASSAAKAANML